MEKQIDLRIPWALIATVVLYYLYSEMYKTLIVPAFNFGGMVHDPRHDGFIDLAILAFSSFLLPEKIKVPSDLYNWLYFILLLIPSAVLSSEQGSDRYHLCLMFAALWGSMLFSRIFTLTTHRRDVVLGVSHADSLVHGDVALTHQRNCYYLPYISIFILVVGILLFLAVSVRGAFNLNFENVYDLRFDISENMPLILRYLMIMAASTFVGYLGALAYHRKDIKGLLLIVLTGILFFGFSSHKSMLFNPLVAIAGYFILKMPRSHLLILAILSVLTVVTLRLPDDGSKVLGTLFANRVVFIPNHINFFYFDFFSNNPFMLWAESKISFGLVESTLPMGVMNYIGGLMTDNYDIGANTGWVANAYMNAGVIGIVIYAAIIGCIYSLIDYWTIVYGKQLVGAAFLIPVTTLITTADLLIVLLTSGLFILLTIFQISTVRIHTHNHSDFRDKKMAVRSNA